MYPIFCGRFSQALSDWIWRVSELSFSGLSIVGVGVCGHLRTVRDLSSGHLNVVLAQCYRDRKVNHGLDHRCALLQAFACIRYSLTSDRFPSLCGFNILSKSIKYRLANTNPTDIWFSHKLASFQPLMCLTDGVLLRWYFLFFLIMFRQNLDSCALMPNHGPTCPLVTLCAYAPKLHPFLNYWGHCIGNTQSHRNDFILLPWSMLFNHRGLQRGRWIS